MYEKRETRDGSITYYNAEFDETYHSMSGALDEALQKHVIPSELMTKESAVILDVCYGLGYNSFVALAFWLEQGFEQGNLNFICLENDRKIIDLGLAQKLPKVLNYAQSFFNEVATHPGVSCRAPYVSATLHIDDFRSQVQKLADASVNIVFFDPFSPKKVPELWSLEVFEELFRVMADGAILTTYSCARKVREALHAAGFVVEDGPCVGRKSPGTLARKVKL